MKNLRTSGEFIIGIRCLFDECVNEVVEQILTENSRWGMEKYSSQIQVQQTLKLSLSSRQCYADFNQAFIYIRWKSWRNNRKSAEECKEKYELFLKSFMYFDLMFS